MEKLIFDTGIKEFEVNGKGVLRFNPADPNVYARFMDMSDKIRTVEKDLAERAQKLDDADNETRGAETLRIMRIADEKMKSLLAEVFGAENDFDQIFEGINLMAVASNGERVISNFYTAIEPVIMSGVQACVAEEVAEAKLNREQRRAMQ